MGKRKNGNIFLGLGLNNMAQAPMERLESLGSPGPSVSFRWACAGEIEFGSQETAND